jgi:hypothetical protein
MSETVLGKNFTRMAGPKSIYYIEENAYVVVVGIDVSFKIYCGKCRAPFPQPFRLASYLWWDFRRDNEK